MKIPFEQDWLSNSMPVYSYYGGQEGSGCRAEGQKKRPMGLIQNRSGQSKGQCGHDKSRFSQSKSKQL